MKRLKLQLPKLRSPKGLAGLGVVFTVFVLATFPCLAVEGTVMKTAKIRAQMSTESETVGSIEYGKTIEILKAEKDSAGTVWYKVSVANGGYGYIRSDLVKANGNIEVTASTANTQSVQPAETVPTTVDAQSATVDSSSNANVRASASTDGRVIQSLPKGTGITVIGEATGGDGKKWYQITCNYNGKDIEGYIRSDLISLGGPVSDEGGDGAGGEGTEGAEGETPEGAEGENPEGGEGENPEGGEGENPEGSEGEAPEEEEHNDYDIAYKMNENTGEYEYYLYDYINQTQTRIADIQTLLNNVNEGNDQLQSQAEKERIVIIILAAVIVVLFIVLTILLFKIRDLYYGDYEEDEEEEEEEPEEEPAPVRRKKSTSSQGEETRPTRSSERPPKSAERSSKSSERPSRSSERPSKGSERAQGKGKQDRELYAAERKEPAKKQSSRKAQNFLVDDDEFEFEFLNMDDKDL